ncbi:MAG: S41 family peptidase [Bacteroidia bacterium]|nr:S41 family peptidase [Bacteroidia bacterium]MBT8277217.1 S41 family peptidase [Bacteroidia bacterium]NNF30738.1 S41 family peptidase [Flavobacteriaceae bacterium]NNK54817.1 S41 family peptidase [Flavobacteriaceae bacterium]NNM08219.1 S41 family peptidase [Flavobacteriaceae bacterium]
MGIQKKYLPLLLGVAIAAGVFIGSKLDFSDSNEKIFATNSKKDKLNRLIDYIDYEYVDQVNTDSIVDVTVNGILENLDPHSVYIPVDDYEDNADDMRGNFVGIGISFYPYKDSIAVIRAIEGGPAAKAGIKGGDRILFADGRPLFGSDIFRDSISAFLKGEINSKVNLTIYRPSEDKMIDVKLKRKRVPLVSVDAAYQLTDEIGYIKVNRFSETTYDEFSKALDELSDEGIETLVLDLRNNPGGYIYAAEKMVDEFLGKDKLMLITRNKNGEENRSYATRKGDFEKGNVYVLINENSASASEIVAGALQDNDKGTIIGRRSFGKGLVQREMALGDGSAVRLTIARYYTPTGRSIQKPYGNGNGDYYSDYENRYKNGELEDPENIEVADSLRFVTPGGKIVYGGGGIIPDVFVPKDTSVENETLEYISRSGFISYFIFEYLEKNRTFFFGMTFNQFADNFDVPESLKEEFIEYSRFEEAQIDLRKYDEDLGIALKANIAQQLYGPNAFEYFLNDGDAMLNKVLDLESAEPDKEE